MLDTTYRQCTSCVLDTSDSSIRFDTNGVCNYCLNYQTHVKNTIYEGQEGEEKLLELVERVKKAGRKTEYDCLVGVSGGVDSTYLVYLMKQWGLRPLAMHFDNGWNSELAVMNITNTLKKLDIDLYTHVVNWEEFKDLQMSYLKASVLDIEVPTDHGFVASLYKIAAKHNLKYIFTGHNNVTESVLPSVWYYNKDDATNLLAIQKRYGSVKLKTFPYYTVADKFYYQNVLKLRILYPLNFVDYTKKEVKKVIIKELGWRDYGGKHYESIFTRFYQGYILPTKFNIDKRKAHLSNLICSEQITREEALEELDKPIYDSEQLLVDKEFVLKKLGLTDQEFEDIMKLPIKQHTDFPTNQRIYNFYMSALRRLGPLSNLLKRLGYK
ncbi:MAG: N-acetyl sugar amidotransferase [Flavobacteriales bacterium]|nr:N-acetyl sugar amidotransferase [Flavobacteriales bacterium]